MQTARQFERTFRCRVHPCSNVKGPANHWFVAGVDKNGRIWFSPWGAKGEALNIHGSVEVCSENCLHRQLSKWAAGEITALDRPAAPSPAVLRLDSFTAWVSDVYKTTAKGPGFGSKPARIVNYMDAGARRSIWCFRESAFDQVERAVGAHVTFRVQKHGEFLNITDVLEIDGQPIAKDAV